MKMNEIITEKRQALAKITTKSGKQAWVAAPVQAQFQAFVNDLEATGYYIYSIGGHNPRRTSSGKWSHHAQGLAIDINPDDNPHNKGPNAKLVTDMPSNISQIARKHGLGWGGNWTRSKDAMHFSAAAREGGNIPVSRGPDIYKGDASVTTTTTSNNVTINPSAPMSTSGANLLRNTGSYSPQLIPTVKKLQTRLEELGYSVGSTGIDGKFGPRTEQAVRRFQQANGLQVDGIVGPETRKALAAAKASTNTSGYGNEFDTKTSGYGNEFD